MNILKDLIEMMSTRPEAWAWAFWAPCFLLLLAATKWPGGGLRLGRLSWWAGALGVLALGIFGWFNYRYLTSNLYLNPMPVQISTVSWYFEQGHPLYPDVHSPEIYSMLYGPYLYIFTGTLEKLLGPSVFAAKLVGLFATLAMSGLLPLLLWRRGAKLFPALFATGIFVCLIAADPFGEYLNRADNFIVLFVLIGAWAAYSPAKFAPFLIGAAMGVCVDLKAHAFIYFIPLAWIAWRTGHRWKGVLAALGTALFFALLPFMAFSNISLKDYVETLRSATHHGLSPPDYVNVVVNAACLCLPFFVVIGLAHLQNAQSTAEALRRQAGFMGWLVFASLLLLVPASKNGSGPHHLLPMSIILLLLAVELTQAGPNLQWSSSPLALGLYAMLASWVISCFGVGVLRSYQYAAYFKMREPWANSIQADVDAIQQKYGSDHFVLMGSGDNDHYEWTLFRPSLIFHGQPVGIDPTAWMEWGFTGIPMPSLGQITEAMSARRPGEKIIWLIPQGGPPFSMHNYYEKWVDGEYQPSPPAYDAKFRADFSQAFHPIASTPYFDLYSN